MPRSRNTFPIRVGNAVVCENIRQELYGKHSLLGVFSGDVLIDRIDAVLSIAIYIELFAINVGKIDLELIISYDNVDLVKVTSEFDYQDVRNPAIIASPVIQIKLERASIIVVTAKCNGQTKRILEKRVREGGSFTASATAPAPLAEQSPTDDLR
jgi:hypothetical protein